MRPCIQQPAMLLRRLLGPAHRAVCERASRRTLSGQSSKAPSSQQFRAHALQNAVPMVGFGVVDCVVMTQVGSTMDAVLGATLGISSITAAAIGLFCSDSCGVLFGGTIESFAGKLGLPAAHLTVEQLELPETKRAATFGRLFGVQFGVILGSASLLLQSPKKLEDEGQKGTKPEAEQEERHQELEGASEGFEALTSSGVVLFTHPGCPFSQAAVDKLLERGVSFKVACFDQFSTQLKSAGSTVSPSIWISGRYIGNQVPDSSFSKP